MKKMILFALVGSIGSTFCMEKEIGEKQEDTLLFATFNVNTIGSADRYKKPNNQSEIRIQLQTQLDLQKNLNNHSNTNATTQVEFSKKTKHTEGFANQNSFFDFAPNSNATQINDRRFTEVSDEEFQELKNLEKIPKFTSPQPQNTLEANTNSQVKNTNFEPMVTHDDFDDMPVLVGSDLAKNQTQLNSNNQQVESEKHELMFTDFDDFSVNNPAPTTYPPETPEEAENKLVDDGKETDDLIDRLMKLSFAQHTRRNHKKRGK